ncbi:MAG: hypothetical protein JO322_09860 [Candidatus Eremiobacteraeota bacterium]|nr:hypothetical protein [Candidatus Eremiobacteraeota bacterium]
MSTDLTTLVALDASSSPNNASSIFDTFRTPFTTIFQRGTINRSGISPGLLNRDGSIAMGNVGQSAFSDDIGFTSIPGSNKTHVVQWSDPGNTCFQGPDAVDGNHAFYYFFLLGNGGCSYPRTIPDEIGIMNFHTFTYAGYINLPNNHRNALDVSQINGDLYVPVGSNIYVWNIAACGCARVQRELPGYFSDAVPVADRSGQHLILYGHPASNANEMDVISVNAQTGALEHTYYKGLSASGDHTYVTSALAQ